MPDEPATAIPGDPALPEPSDPAAEPGDPPADEPTVAISPDPDGEAPVPDPVTPSESEPPAPTAVTPSETVAGALTRRQLLIGLSGVTGAVLVGGVVAVHSATSGSGEAPARSLVSPAVTRPRVPESAPVTAPPVPVRPRPIYSLAEYRQATGATAFPSGAVALTIDDGPHPVWTPRLLRLLDKYHVPALFCMIGNQVLGHEAVARTVTRAGHQLANHTWSHPTKLAGKPGPLVQKEIRKAQAKIENITGYAPKLFRSPGGDWSPQLLHQVAQAGLLPLDWGVDPRDWARPGVTTIEHRLLAARPGQILLCHDGGGDRSQTYNALSVVIPALKARGLEFVALQG